MEVEANPLNLSLEEIIALNKTKCDLQEVVVHEESPVMISGQGQTENSIINRLRERPGFGTRPIHQRLGFKNKRHNKSPAQLYTQLQVQKAKCNLLKRARSDIENPLVTFINPNALKQSFVTPLRGNAMSKFNGMRNNGFKNGPNGTVRSAFLQRSAANTVVRHSLKKSLDPLIQIQIQDLSMQGTQIDVDSLSDFRTTPHGTIMATHERFSNYF